MKNGQGIRKIPLRRAFRLLGVVIFFIFFILALFAGNIAPYHPRERFEPYTSPTLKHLLGTNDIGNDIFSELIHGSRVSLLVGLLTGILSTVLGVIVGLVSGFKGGLADEVLMGMTDMVLMIPRIPLIIVLAAFVKPGFWLIAAVMGMLWWTSTARVVRSQTLQVKTMHFIQSARCLGFSTVHIIFSDLLPSVFLVVIPEFFLSVASAMISEASLSFLGLGDPSMKSWGMMINFAFRKGGFLNGMWWWYLPPGLCITFFVMSILFLSFSFEERQFLPEIGGEDVTLAD